MNRSNQAHSDQTDRLAVTDVREAESVQNSRFDIANLFPKLTLTH